MAARLCYSLPRVALQRRSYATSSAPKASSNTLPILGGLAVAAGATWYYLTGGQTPDPRELKVLEEKAKAAVGLNNSIPAKIDTASAPGKSALDPKEFRTFTVKRVDPYNHNTSKFVIELPDGTDSGLPVASAVVTRASDGKLKDDAGKDVIRPYTPTSGPETHGEMHFLVKKYEQGKMSKHFHELKPGSTIDIKGPIPKFPWQANQFESVGFITGGSGVTPSYQIAQTIDANPDDKTKFTLIFSNVTEQDILLKKEFEDLARRKPDQFKILFSLDKPPKGWKGHSGFVTPEFVSQSLPSAKLGEKTKIFVCGPPGQVAAVAGPKDGMKQGELKGMLSELGYTPEQVYKF